ncbi:hypothetical protein HanIR_Chr15g0738211 [Helianthus annuus]|nr:hypothetical protein HanIR_Chr15g0738211 [Helianthus annuus]
MILGGSLIPGTSDRTGKWWAKGKVRVWRKRNLWGLALVAKAVNLETLVDLNRLLRIAKVKYSSIQYLGGLSTLITFADENAANYFLKSGDVWGPWFSKLDAWEGQSLPFERVAWIRLLGVPLHLLESDVVKMIGERFGKVLYVPNSSGEEKDLSMVRVGVLLGEVDRIKEFVVVLWKDRSFRVLAEEELDVWVPDCLGVGVDACPSGCSQSVASPAVSPGDPGNSGTNNVAVEESCMGEGAVGVNNQTKFTSMGPGSGEGHNEVHINWESFVGPDDGNVGSTKGGIHFFKAGRKTKRFRKGGSKNLGHTVVDSPSGLLDSVEKGRPKKRNRAQGSDPFEEVMESVDSDPFSLDNLLNQMRDKMNTKGGGQSPAATVNLNQPLDSEGRPVDNSEGMEGEETPEAQVHRIVDPIDSGGGFGGYGFGQ